MVADEWGIIAGFRLRGAAEDCASLFAGDYADPVGVPARAETPVEDVDYALFLIYGSASGEPE